MKEAVMKKVFVLVGLALAALAATAAPATAQGLVECPEDFVLQAPPVPDVPERLADRNGDRAICELRVQVLGRTLVVLTDNGIGDPGIIPPGPCTDPFFAVPVLIGDPSIRQIDVNADRIVCGFAEVSRAGATLVLLDNPNATAPPEPE
jgi:hypothetical protein